jgi:dGTPase
MEDLSLAQGATRARGAGHRESPEEPDAERTCFERDRDRIVHSTSFRRLAGKTQVFVFPDDHQRTRLTHALEVAQVATAVARATGLNVALTEAIALGHDCGHGPGGHASEDAFDSFVPGGFHHAPWGADVSLHPLNLCLETLDGIRNHSWSRPSPSTPEGEVVSWADRCAYCAHDLEDAIHAGIVSAEEIPTSITSLAGTTRAQQLRTFIGALVSCARGSGTVGMVPEIAGALAQLRDFNYRRIYTRAESVSQGRAVVDVLRALVEHFASRPDDLPSRPAVVPSSDEAIRTAVAYVDGMTDRFAFSTAVRLLGWPEERLPAGIDIATSS